MHWIMASSLAISALWAGASAADVQPAPEAPAPEVRAWQTGLTRPDRLQHTSLAFSLGLCAGLTTREPRIAAGSAMVLGIAKELRDARHSRFDWMDLTADMIGASLAALLSGTMRR